MTTATATFNHSFQPLLSTTTFNKKRKGSLAILTSPTNLLLFNKSGNFEYGKSCTFD